MQVSISFHCNVSGLSNEWRALEISVRGRSRSLEMTPFDRPHTSYMLSTVQFYEHILYIFSEVSEILIEHRDFYSPPAFHAPVKGIP